MTTLAEQIVEAVLSTPKIDKGYFCHGDHHSDSVTDKPHAIARVQELLVAAKDAKIGVLPWPTECDTIADTDVEIKDTVN